MSFGESVSTCLISTSTSTVGRHDEGRTAVYASRLDDRGSP